MPLEHLNLFSGSVISWQDFLHSPFSQRLNPGSHTGFFLQSSLLSTQEKSAHWYWPAEQDLIKGWAQCPLNWQLPSGHNTFPLGQVILVGHKS